jgi:hypothetical protein
VTEIADRLAAVLTTAIEHLRDSPQTAAGALLIAGFLYYLLQRKSRLEREADRRLGQLQRDKAGTYDHLRPPH